MTNSLVPIAGNIPTVFQGRPDDTADLGAGITASFGILTFRGKIWRTKYKGEERAIMRPDEPGSPVSFLDLVIVKASPVISKIFYLKGYVEGDTDAPDCFSVNGLTPDPASPARQAPHCATCPHNVWGSRTTEAGKKGKACSDSKRMAVVPEQDLRNEAFGGPMMLRCPPASLQGLSTYSADLQRAGGRYYGAVTRVHFDVQAAYPHLVFMPKRWLTNEEGLTIVDLQDGPVVNRILSEAVEAVRAEGDAPPGTAATAHMAGGPPNMPSTVSASVQPTTPAAAAAAAQPAPQPVTQAQPAQQPSQQGETIDQMRTRIETEMRARVEAEHRAAATPAAAPQVIHAPDQSGVIVTPAPAQPTDDQLKIPDFLKGAAPPASAFAPGPAPAAVVAPPVLVEPVTAPTFAQPVAVQPAAPQPVQPATPPPPPANETREQMAIRLEAEIRAKIAAEKKPGRPRTRAPSPTNGASPGGAAPASAFGQPAGQPAQVTQPAAPSGFGAPPAGPHAAPHPDPAFTAALAQPVTASPQPTGQPAPQAAAEPVLTPQPGPGSTALADLNAKLAGLLPNT